MLGTKFRQIYLVIFNLGAIFSVKFCDVVGVEFTYSSCCWYIYIWIYGSMNEWVIMFTSGLRFVSIKDILRRQCVFEWIHFVSVEGLVS